jgi:hypothetical protein
VQECLARADALMYEHKQGKRLRPPHGAFEPGPAARAPAPAPQGGPPLEHLPQRG